MGTDVETVVIGAGVVGLAIARALAGAGQEVLVLERHRGVGMETSSRSSEVIHGGIYYPPGSLKARLCVAGRGMLYDFAAENGVAHKRCGKLIVATSEAETATLSAIAATAARNGVSDLAMITAAEAHALEPAVTCVAGLISPSTGIIDSHGLMLALEGHITAGGGRVVLNTKVTGIARDEAQDFTIATTGADGAAELVARRLVIAGGLGATELGRMLAGAPGYSVPETHLARGHYFVLRGRTPFRHLVYPVPEPGALGIHLTLDIAGAARFGPDIEWVADGETDLEEIYAFNDPDGARRLRFEAAIRRYWPGLPEGALEPGYIGLRPKVSRQGEPAADFAIHGEAQHGIARMVALYGIESPGLTSSLAIGEVVAGLLR